MNNGAVIPTNPSRLGSAPLWLWLYRETHFSLSLYSSMYFDMVCLCNNHHNQVTERSHRTSTQVSNHYKILSLYMGTHHKSKGENFSTSGQKHVISERSLWRPPKAMTQSPWKLCNCHVIFSGSLWILLCTIVLWEEYFSGLGQSVCVMCCLTSAVLSKRQVSQCDFLALLPSQRALNQLRFPGWLGIFSQC